jgi:hypothetical protein
MSLPSNPERTTPAHEQETRMRSQELIIRLSHWCSCINCDYWLKAEELCDRYKVRPPANVIVTGCNTWTDEVPF